MEDVGAPGVGEVGGRGPETPALSLAWSEDHFGIICLGKSMFSNSFHKKGH